MRTFFGLPYTYSIYTVVLFGFDLCIGGAPLCTGDSESLTSVPLGRVVTPDPGMCSVGSRMLAKISSKDTESLLSSGGGCHCLYEQEPDLEGEAHPESLPQVGMAKLNQGKVAHIHSHLQ